MSTQTCLRTMSCTCPLCAGEDIADLLNVQRAFKSTINHDDEETAEEEDTSQAPEPPAQSIPRSPPLPAARQPAVANSPPIPAQRKAPTETEDVNMEAPPPAPVSRVANSPPAVQSTPSALPSLDLASSDPPSEAPPTEAKSASATDTTSMMSLDEIVANVKEKNWMTRKSAYESAMQLADRPDLKSDDVRPLLELYVKMCQDPIAGALEPGIRAVLAYAKNVQDVDETIIPPIIKRVADKGLAGRSSVQAASAELVDNFVAAGAATPTIEALLEAAGGKKPKVASASLQCVLDALKEYGPKVVPVQSIVKALPKLCESTVNGVRPVAMQILVELHRWIGPAVVQGIVDNLRQAQQTEFADQTKDITPGQAEATKFIRGAKAVETKAQTKAPVMDAREFTAEVDLLSKLSQLQFYKQIQEAKWSIRMEALQAVVDAAGPVPKLTNGDYYELVSVLKKLLSDSNVNVQGKAIEVMSVLADGLRKNFSPHARQLFSDLLKKLSDKKVSVLQPTNKALDMFLMHCMGIDLMLDDLKVAMDSSKNKAPPARAQTLGFLRRCVEVPMINVSDKAVLMDLGKLMLVGIDDTDPTVRKAGQEAFVALLKSSEDAPKLVKPLMEKLQTSNARAFKTVKQQLDGNASSSPATSRPASAASSTSSRPSSGKTKAKATTDVDMESKTPETKAPEIKKPKGPSSRFGSKPPAKKSAAPTKTSGGGGSTEYSPIAMSTEAEEADGVVEGLGIPDFAQVQAGLASSKWLERKAAIEALESFAREHSEELTPKVIEALTLYLGKNVKQFKESNINVLRCAFQAIGTLAENTPGKFPKSVVTLVVPLATDKAGDKKAADVIRSMKLALCEATSPSYTLGCMMQHLGQVRAPLAQLEALMTIKQVVEEFGLTECGPRAIVDFTKGPQATDSSNPKVRGAAISLLGAMYTQLGPNLLPILNLDSWKPALAKLVQAEFERVGYDPEKAQASVKRKVKGEEGPPKADAEPVFGRVDISKHLTKELFDRLKDENGPASWKRRAAAMDNVQSVLDDAGGAIEFSKSVQDLLRAMKPRLNDSNANLKVRAAQVLGSIATSVGPDIHRASKALGSSIVHGVGDNKKSMQQASIDTLHKWVTHDKETKSVCVESLLPATSEGLANSVGRGELLGWLATHLDKCGKLDLSVLVTPTVQSLGDKNADTRSKAQTVLKIVAASVGKKAVMDGCRDLKPAQMRSLKPMLEKVLETSPDKKPSPITRTTSMPVKAAASSEIPAPGLKSRTQSMRPSDAASKDTLLRMSTNKASRMSRGAHVKWTVDVSDQSDVEKRRNELQTEWRPLLSSEMADKLFSDKSLMEGNDLLLGCASSQPQEMLSVMDMAFKWCALRFADSNAQALGKLLDLLVKLLQLLVDEQTQMQDAEAAILLPVLLQQSGQPKMRFLVRIRQVLSLVTQVYSTEKLSGYLDEGFQSLKSINSRVECLRLCVELVNAHGTNALGRKTLRDAANLAGAKESALRVAALDLVVAAYDQSSMDVDAFHKFIGVSNAALADAIERELRMKSKRGVETKEVSTPPRPSPPKPSPVRRPVATTPEKPQVDSVEDPFMSQVEGMIFTPLTNMVTSDGTHVVDHSSQEFVDGKNAMKTLFALLTAPSDDSERTFVAQHVNRIVEALCTCVHAGFSGGDTDAPLDFSILSLSLATLNTVLLSPQAENLQRYAVERLVLELCHKVLDERLESAAEVAPKGPTAYQEKQLVYVYKALLKMLHVVQEKLAIRIVFPSVLGALQRIVRNEVGEYTSRSQYRHLLKKDTLDQIVGRLLVSLADKQAASDRPFDSVDVYGVLMQVHYSFYTLPQNDMFSGQIAKETLEQVLKTMAKSLVDSGASTFEKSVKDLPAGSRVRQVIAGMGYEFAQEEEVEEESKSRFGAQRRDVESQMSSLQQTMSRLKTKGTTSSNLRERLKKMQQQ